MTVGGAHAEPGSGAPIFDWPASPNGGAALGSNTNSFEEPWKPLKDRHFRPSRAFAGVTQAAWGEAAEALDTMRRQEIARMLEEGKRTRQHAYLLRQGLRPSRWEGHEGDGDNPRQWKCGHVRVGFGEGPALPGSVEVRSHRVSGEMPDGTPMERRSASWGGILECGDVWGCPTCYLKRASQRARLLRTLEDVAREEHMGVYMLTLTVRHALGHSLSEMVQALPEAWANLQQRKLWRDLRDAHEPFMVRALEVTHGRCGWHPHLHVLVVTDCRLAKAEVASLQCDIRDAWVQIIGRRMGADHVPAWDIGAVFAECKACDYLSKMSMELSDPGTKRAKRGNRKPWQIAEDWTRYGSREDGRLWNEYLGAMHGRALHTATHGLFAFLEDIAQQRDVSELDAVIVLPQLTWTVIRGIRGARALVLEAAEDHDPVGAVADLIATLPACVIPGLVWHEESGQWVRSGDASDAAPWHPHAAAAEVRRISTKPAHSPILGGTCTPAHTQPLLE